jgi:hypothetical protein
MVNDQILQEVPVSALAEIAPGVQFNGETLHFTVTDEFGPCPMQFTGITISDLHSTPYFFADAKGNERYVDPTTGEVTGKNAPRR